MDTLLTVAELPANELREQIDDVLRRVQAGEEIVVTIDGKPIVTLRAPQQSGPTLTVNELLASLAEIPIDPTFASDIRKMSGEDDEYER